MYEHGVLARQGLHSVTELDDFVAVHTAHPCVDVPACVRVCMCLCVYVWFACVHAYVCTRQY
jgi:hypothetical protein